jgi:hypothetical protein
MKTVLKYLFAILLPGISLMTNGKVGIGIIVLLLHIGAYSWTIIMKVIGGISAGAAMSILTKVNIAALTKLNNAGPVVWLILASVAVYFVWRIESHKNIDEPSISSLS